MKAFSLIEKDIEADLMELVPLSLLEIVHPKVSFSHCALGNTLIIFD